VATSGTHRFLTGEGLEVARVNKVQQGRPHIVDLIKDGKVQLVFNTTEGAQAMKDSQSIRASAVSGKVPYFTTAAAALAAVRAMAAMRERTLEVAPLQSYYRS
jgi:carbamoyl-phosphate synthase large subunit